MYRSRGLKTKLKTRKKNARMAIFHPRGLCGWRYPKQRPHCNVELKWRVNERKRRSRGDDLCFVWHAFQNHSRSCYLLIIIITTAGIKVTLSQWIVTGALYIKPSHTGVMQWKVSYLDDILRQCPLPGRGDRKSLVAADALDMVVYVTGTKKESLTQGREFAAVLMLIFDTSVHISNQINQSNKLFYSAPKSWPESWPT